MKNSNHSLLLGPIIGGLTHEGANLWARLKPTDSQNLKINAWLGQSPDLSDAVLAGSSLPVSADNGYAGVAPVRGLSPETTYFYSLTTLETPPQIGAGPLARGFYPTFKTFPEPGTSASFKFAFGSCFRPTGPSSGRIFYSLERIRQRDDLKFILLVGDQIYADDYRTNSLGKVAESLGEYRKVYEYAWSIQSLKKLFWSLPVFMTIDDHEVDDDWRWKDHRREHPIIPWWNTMIRWIDRRPKSERFLSNSRVKTALKAYWEHQGMHAPGMLAPLALDGIERYSLDERDPGSLAYTFEYGPAAFFVMDTRTMRVRSGFGQKQTMLGSGQWGQLCDWLLSVKDRFLVKFVVSSCSLLYSSWIDIPRDRWTGYKSERDRLLQFIADHEIDNVFFLSGDFHFGFAIYAELVRINKRNLPLWEFCSSPFEQEIGKWAAKTRTKIRNGIFGCQDLLFSVTENNFGVVEVSIQDHQMPSVSFELLDDHGRRLGGVHQARLIL